MTLLHKKLKEYIKQNEFKYNKTQQYKYIKNSIDRGFSDLSLIINYIQDTTTFDEIILLNIIHLLEELKNKYSKESYIINKKKELLKMVLQNLEINSHLYFS